jgi:hypothetical protein
MTNKRLDDLLAKARTRTGTASPAKKVKAQQLALPFWPEEVRSIPNAVLRGALFGVANIRETHSKRTVIATLEGIEIRFLGTRPNQTDLDVWETLLHAQRLQPLGSRVEFTAHALLKELGRQTGQTQHEQLKEEIARLAAGLLEVTWTKERKTFAGTLISSFFRDEDTGRYVVSFNQDFATLYGHGATYVDRDQRAALGRDNLAKWLHGFFASHANPFPYKVATLKSLCGSKQEEKSFKQQLKKALARLVEIGVIRSWEIDYDLVTVKKVPTSSQERFLGRAQRKKAP